MRNSVIAAFAVLVLAVGIASARAQEVPLKAGQSADLGPVYWVNQCQSILKRIVGVEKLSGPAHVTLAIREQSVRAVRQGCPGEFPGGMVVATAGAIAAPITEAISYRVTYDTQVGTRMSTHTVRLVLSP